MIYNILNIIAIIFSISSSIIYLLIHLNKFKNKNSPRILLFSSIAIVIFFSFFLLYLITSHNYHYSYVFFNSSSSLPLPILLSSFYAGQEGSFLLWLTCISIIAIIIYPKIKIMEYENIAYSIVSLIIFFFLIFIYIKNPFSLLSQDRPNDFKLLLENYPNGYGLNPILENIWMVIHPPILFIGYSTVLVPFILALSALIKNDYIKWIKLAIPWTIISNIFLGLGLILGGFWSYETLGWGGYWAWDPVENSSLVPWIITIVLSHTLLVQKRTGGLVKTNLILSILAFIFVIYSTFLTRSGILADFSVHTFEKSENPLSILIIIFILLLIIFSIIIFSLRYGFLSRLNNRFQFATKEYFISLGVVSLLLSAFVIFVGTNLPIIQNILGYKPKKLETSFFNNWNLPFIFISMSLLFISILLNWKKVTLQRNVKIIISFIFLSLIVLTISLLVGNYYLANILLIVISLIAFIFNAYYFLQKLIGFYQIGSYFSHIGFSLLIIGIVLSGIFSEQHIIELKQDEVKDTLGYNLKYLGSELIDDGRDELDSYKFKIVINENGQTNQYLLAPKYNLYPRKKQQTFEPDIVTTIFKDIYASPFMLNKQYEIPFVNLNKNNTHIISIDTNYTVTLKDFIFHRFDENDEDKPIIGIILEFHNLKQNLFLIDTIFTKVNVQSGEIEEKIYDLPMSDIKILIQQFRMKTATNPSYITVGFARIKDFPLIYKEVLTIELSIKPYILLVWIGSISIIIGFIFAIFRHLKNRYV